MSKSLDRNFTSGLDFNLSQQQVSHSGISHIDIVMRRVLLYAAGFLHLLVVETLCTDKPTTVLFLQKNLVFSRLLRTRRSTELPETTTAEILLTKSFWFSIRSSTELDTVFVGVASVGRISKMASVRQRTNRDLGGENGQGKVVYYVASHPWKRKRTSTPTVTREGQTPERDDKKTMNWQQRLSLLLINLLWDSHDVLAFVGFVVEWTLNFLALNGSFWTLPFRCIFHFNELVFPKEGESNYHTLIWQLDPRTKLYTDTSASAKAHSTKTDTDCFPVEGTGSRATLDVTIMASKLVYENPEVVKKVVEQDWNMHFVGFYTCWNECHKKRSTEAFIFADKPQNMNAIVIAWRGTEPFNTWDWSTDIDFSWARFQNGMAVHLGFLEALGLCHRDNVDSFIKMDNNAQKKRNKHTADHPKRTKEEINNTPATSGLSDDIIANDSQILAYDDITKIVAKLLYDNPHAQLFVTGHSLGGALAAVYGAMLHYNAETEITDRLAAIYTFGQPRVGDQNFANYANQKLKGHYNRVVYCNDIVPRVPFDNKLFQFKHFGGCDYYDNCYNRMVCTQYT
jgi:hypothetical protein